MLFFHILHDSLALDSDNRMPQHNIAQRQSEFHRLVGKMGWKNTT